MVSLFHTFTAKLRGLFSRQRADEEFHDEIKDHLQLLTERFRNQGMSAADAKAAAWRQFGNATLIQQRYREIRNFLSLTNLCRDLLFAMRQLSRNPLLTIVAIVSLALGIGANTAIFTVAKKVLLDTLAVKNPHELRMLTWVSGHEQPVPPLWGDVSPTKEGGLTSTSFSYPVLEELRKKSGVVQDLLAFKDIGEMTATIDGHPELISGELLSGNAFSMLGVEPILGRSFLPTEDAAPGSGPVAIISESYWEKRFNRSSSTLGKIISVNGVPLTIIGISPARFTGLQLGSTAQIFVPLTMQPLLIPQAQLTESGNLSLLNNPQSWWVLIMARLRPDVSEKQAQSEFDVMLRQATLATLPTVKDIDHFHLRLEPGERGLDYLSSFTEPSYILLALAGLVLLLACVNLANLLLARAAARQREMSTRLAIGARRMHILRQVLTESLLLSCMGGIAGFVLGYLGRNVLPRLIGNPWRPAALQVNFDWQVLAFTIAVSLATGILFGVAPAWQAMHCEINTALKNTHAASANRHKIRLGRGLVVFQIALSTILLIGAGLFVRTLINLGRTSLGFRADHILLFQLNPPRTRYTDARMAMIYRQLEERFAAIPGVRSVGLSNIAIIGDGHSGSTFHISGQPRNKNEVRVQMNSVGAEFFQTMGIPILQGRSLNQHDTASSPKIAVINHTLAHRFFPDEDPIGMTFEEEEDPGPVQIVGIAADTKYANLREETPPTFYVPYQQRNRLGRMMVEIRTAGEPGSILSKVRTTVESLDRDLPLIDVRTMNEQVNASMAEEKIFAELTGGFGILALILACIGIYGITAYAVARRTGEIGVRMALGARSGQVLTMVLREASWMAVTGVSLGIVGALWLTRFIRAMLYGLNAADPLTLAGAAVLLIAITLLASFGPARRAAHIDPIRALRHE